MNNKPHAETQQISVNTDCNVLYDLIKECMSKLERTTQKTVAKFYVGKSYMDFKDLSLNYSGVLSRWKHHRKKPYCQNGLVIFALINESWIPRYCRVNGCYENHEEYALTVERRLIQKFMEDVNYKGRLANKGTKPGQESKTPHCYSVIYVTFTLEGNIHNFLLAYSHIHNDV